MLLYFERNSSKAGGLRPEVEAILSAIVQSEFHHLEYGFRPPVGIYRTSISQVWPRFNTLIDAVNSISEKVPFSEDRNLEDDILEKAKQLLYSICEHLEDCENVLRCCFPQGRNYGKYQQVKSYRQAVDAYKDQVARIVNRIKHNQARLRQIIFHGESWISPGYFVEGVHPDGALGPDATVHNGACRAFSYAYDLRYHFISIYFVSACLAKAIISIKGYGSVKDIADSSADNELFDMAMKLANTNRIIFPDEDCKPYPIIMPAKTHSENTIRMFLLPAGLAPIPTPEYFNVHVSYRGDGVSNRFIIPYSNMRVGKEPK